MILIEIWLILIGSIAQYQHVSQNFRNQSHLVNMLQIFILGQTMGLNPPAVKLSFFSESAIC